MPTTVVMSWHLLAAQPVRLPPRCCQPACLPLFEKLGTRFKAVE